MNYLLHSRLTFYFHRFQTDFSYLSTLLYLKFNNEETLLLFAISITVSSYSSSSVEDDIWRAG